MRGFVPGFGDALCDRACVCLSGVRYFAAQDAQDECGYEPKRYELENPLSGKSVTKVCDFIVPCRQTTHATRKHTS